MGLLDSLFKDIKSSISKEIKSDIKSAGSDVAKNIQNSISYQTKTFKFDNIPQSLEALKALPEAALKDPFATAALSILALNMYTVNKDICIEMLRFLKGPGDISPRDIQFLADRFRDKNNAPVSYFSGATPENNYTPSMPYTIVLKEGAHSKDCEGYFKAFITSGGADNDRYLILRTKPSTGEWFLHEYEGLLAGVKVAKADNPWA